MEQIMYLGIVAGIVALAAAFYYSKKVESYEINIPKVAEITDAIRAVSYTHLTLPTT